MASPDSNTVPHLWDVDHPYYCNESNYFSNDCTCEYKSWADFMENMANADLDMNLLFRWDWEAPRLDDGGDHDGELPITWRGDENYRDCILKLFFMGQRNGRFFVNTIEVCRADESAIREYLDVRFRHLMSLWEPLATGGSR